MSTSIPIHDFFPPPRVQPDCDPLQLSLAIPKPTSFPSPLPNPLDSTLRPIPSAALEALLVLPLTSSFSLSNHVGGSLSGLQSRQKRGRRSSKKTCSGGKTESLSGLQSRQKRGRRSSKETRSGGKTETVEPIYPWATNRRATVHSMSHLLSNGITTITGTVECKRCVKKFEISYDLEEKFNEIALFILKKKFAMHDRAPSAWLKPPLLNCKFCEQINCVKPVQSKKRSINWLFLLLGQFLGFCKISDLRYFCKHTNNHRTGAKDRVLYLTYMDLCNQLVPNGPFDI